MAKSIFRQFPSDDIDLEPGTEESDIGQPFIRTAVGSVAPLVLDDFWEFVQGGGGPVSLAATISGVFLDSATMSVVRGVQAALTGQLSPSASLDAARQMASLVSSASTAAGALRIARALEAAVSGAVLTQVGQLHVGRVLSALYNIASGVSAVMPVERGLVDPMEAALSTSAMLSVGAEASSSAPIEVTAEFSGISIRGSHINSMGWLAVAGERRVRLRSIFRAHRLQREEDEIRRMQKRAKRRPIDK